MDCLQLFFLGGIMQFFGQGSTWSSWNVAVVAAVLALSAMVAHGQSSGNSMVSGTVADPSGAVVGGAVVEMRNPVS